jgi:hypothetical protein
MERRLQSSPDTVLRTIFSPRIVIARDVAVAPNIQRAEDLAVHDE